MLPMAIRMLSLQYLTIHGQTFNTMSLSIPDPNGPTNIDDNVPISPPIISGNNVYVTWNEQPDYPNR